MGGDLRRSSDLTFHCKQNLDEIILKTSCVGNSTMSLGMMLQGTSVIKKYFFLILSWNLSSCSLYSLGIVFSSVLFVAVLCILGYCDEVSPNFLLSKVIWCSSFSLYSEDRLSCSSSWTPLDPFQSVHVCLELWGPGLDAELPVWRDK